MKYTATIDTNDYKDFKFFEDAFGEYLAARDVNAGPGEWLPLRFTKVESETDYKKYINALRKCAKEHDNDRTFTGHIIVSDLCRDTANLLEKLEQKEETDDK